jgi:hypothetical protein
VPMPSGTRASWMTVKPDAVSAKDSLAIFIDGQKSSVQAVYVRAQHGKRFRQNHTQSQTSRVRVKNVHAALQSGKGRRGRSRSGEERNVDERATRMQRDSRNIAVLRNAFELGLRGNRLQRKVRVTLSLHLYQVVKVAVGTPVNLTPPARIRTSAP